MLSPAELRVWFEKAHDYDTYLALAEPHELDRWRSIERHVGFSP